MAPRCFICDLEQPDQRHYIAPSNDTISQSAMPIGGWREWNRPHYLGERRTSECLGPGADGVRIGSGTHQRMSLHARYGIVAHVELVSAGVKKLPSGLDPIAVVFHSLSEHSGACPMAFCGLFIALFGSPRARESRDLGPQGACTPVSGDCPTTGLAEVPFRSIDSAGN